MSGPPPAKPPDSPPSDPAPDPPAPTDSPTTLLPLLGTSAPPGPAPPPAGAAEATTVLLPRLGRRLPRHRITLAAAFAVALALIGVPALAIRASDSPPPVVAPASTGAVTGTAAPADATPDSPQDTPRDAAGGPPGRAQPPTARPAPTGPAPVATPSREPEATSPGTGWQQVVDNRSGRFRASDEWRTGTGHGQQHGTDYRYAEPVEASDPAWYRVDIPETGEYLVEVWFPADGSNNARTPYVVVTAAGHQTVHISQQRSGGRWVSLGTFPLEAGDRDVVAVSRWRVSGSGVVVADAIRVTQV